MQKNHPELKKQLLKGEMLMSISDESVYVFCNKDLPPYEMTIYALAMAYAESPLYTVDDDMISDLAQLLMVDEGLLKDALSGKTSFIYGNFCIKFGEKTVDCTDYFKNTFFISIINLHLAYKELDMISDATDKDAIIKNIEYIQSAIFSFYSTNVNNATYECMLEQQFSYEHILYDSGDFPATDYLNILKTLSINDGRFGYDESLLLIISHLAQYELKTRLNALYLIMITQIIMHSPFFEDEIHKMALEMYENLMFILKNGRVISIQVNSLYFDPSKSCDDRTKQDNTTRLQILYGYENFDAYIMRVDLSHQGQPFIHFNNASPGKVSSYLFNEEEYKKTISLYPLLEPCFIEYSNGRWALKERNNCALTKEMARMFDIVESEKAHKGLFSESFSEDCVVKFIELFSNMLPSTCCIPIDKDGEYAHRCFNYDILIRDATLLYLAYINSFIGDKSELIEVLMNNIFDRAINYGLMLNEELIERDSLFGICYVLNLAKEQANITP